ncbi:MAG: polysaccharide deacetylase family protein, partial [Akkermansiaceae bacterium]|nr:polysaccharide deacetylase family protein [Akkermansiaceae bacterium]
LPKNTVAVTFDDGYRDNFDVAAPILKRFGIPSSFFVTTGYIESGSVPWFSRLHRVFQDTRAASWPDPVTGRTYSLNDPRERREAFLAISRRCASSKKTTQDEILAAAEKAMEVSPEPEDGGDLMMSWDDIRAMHAEGFEIGSHTVSHPNLALLRESSDLERQIALSKRHIEDRLDASVNHFAYPNPIGQPHWTDRVREVVMASGYKSASTSVSGWVDRKSDLGSLRRMACPHDLGLFVWRLELAFLGKVT